MMSQTQPIQKTAKPSLSVKELEVLWLYDCHLSEDKIQWLLLLNYRQLNQLKSNLFDFFNAQSIDSMLDIAFMEGYVHKYTA